MRVLVACEFSGIVRDAFLARGHDAISCDFLPSERPGPHYQGDVRDILGDGWDLMVAHPPCTHLCKMRNCRPIDTEGRRLGFEFFMELWNAPIEHVAIENPEGAISKLFRRPNQTIHPWQYGHRYTKATCLWLRNLPMLTPTDIVIGGWRPWLPNGTTRLLGASPNKQDRAKTFPGIADAMASQWSQLYVEPEFLVINWWM